MSITNIGDPKIPFQHRKKRVVCNVTCQSLSVYHCIRHYTCSHIFHVIVDASLCVYLPLRTWFCPFKFLQSRLSWTCSCTSLKRSSFRQLILLHLYCSVRKQGAFAIDTSFERFIFHLIRLVSICPACLSAHLPSFKMPYRAKHPSPKSLAQTPWSHDPHHSICRPLPAMPQVHSQFWTRKTFIPSLENVLVIPIILVVRNARLVCFLPRSNCLQPPKRMLSLKRSIRPQHLQHRVKGRLSGMGKPRLRREKGLRSELYLGRFLRCPGWMKKRKPRKIVLLRSTLMLDATSSLSSLWQMFLKHMKKVLLLRVFLRRHARINSNSVQPMFVFILYLFGISHRADHITVFFRRTWNSWLLWAFSCSVLPIHFSFPFHVQGIAWKSNLFYSGAKTDLFCVYFFLTFRQQQSHEQIITLHKSLPQQIRLRNVCIEVNIMEDSPLSFRDPCSIRIHD